MIQHCKGAMLFHHIACAIVTGTPLYLGNSGAEVVWYLVLAEMSSPFLQCSKLLSVKGTETEGKLLIPFAVLFLFNRGVIGTWLSYNSLTSLKTDVIIKAMIVVVMGLSYYWM